MPSPDLEPILPDITDPIRFDSIVEKYEVQLRHVDDLVQSGSLTSYDALDRKTEIRKQLAAEIIKVDTDKNSIGSAYYENLIHSILLDQMHLLLGAMKAVDRAQRSMLDVYNSVGNGDTEPHIDSQEIDHIVELACQIKFVQTLFAGTGLYMHSQQVIARMIERSVPNAPVKKVATIHG